MPNSIMTQEEKSEVSTRCRQLKLKFKDGKYCETDVLEQNVDENKKANYRL